MTIAHPHEAGEPASLSDYVQSAAWRIQRYSDSLVRAADDGDADAIFGIAGNIRTTADALRRELLPQVFDLQPDIAKGCRDIPDLDGKRERLSHSPRRDLQAALFSVREQRQHLTGSPWDFARLSCEESAIVAQLERGAA